MPNPFGPLPTKPRPEWTAADHQRAANFHHYEIMGIDAEYREANPNYRPHLSMLEAAFREHTRKAAALRAAAS